MNKLIKLFTRSEVVDGVAVELVPFAILETPCRPASWYFGPVEFNRGPKGCYRTGQFIPLDNSTSRWHRSSHEAYVVALKEFPDILTDDDDGNVMTHQEYHSLYA